MSTNYADVQWFGQMRQAADDAARAEYQKAQIEGQGEDRAQRAAEFAWRQTMDRAGLTGMFEGQYTMPTQQYFANTFGTWGTPTQGQQTMAREQQTFGQGATLAGLYGQAFAPGAGPEAGMQTLAGREQAYTQGLRTQQEQRAAQAQGQTQAQNYLQLLAGLRGPADWAKYQQVLGATPGGMRDLYAAAMGQYVPGGGATTGMQPQAANLTTMMQQVAGQPVTWTGQGSVPQQQLYQPSVYQFNPAVYGQQPGQAQPQAQPQAQAGQAPTASNMQLEAFSGRPTAGMQAMQQNEQARMQQAQQAYQQQMPPAAGGGTNMLGAQAPGAPAANQNNLPAPNQISPQAWKNMAPSQQQMLLGEYESQGWHKPDVEALFAQSLPKYGSNAPTAGTFRMR